MSGVEVKTVIADKTIYELELHESLQIKGGVNSFVKFYITRVPGGWIYETGEDQLIFIPWCVEVA